MTPIKASYHFRIADVRDAETIARHRAFMLRDMNSLPEADIAEFIHASVPWLERLLGQQEYVGWFAVLDGEVVAGGGIHVREMGPGVGCLHVGRWGHIVSVYTEPAHRRQGLARALMERILAWAEAERLDRITLTASQEGEPLYRSLGFTSMPEMQLVVRR